MTRKECFEQAMRIVEEMKDYESLVQVYQDAVIQASKGKGRERHAEDGERFEDQIICEVARRVGLGYPLGQAVKKIYESQRIGGDAGVQELLGALNYVAAAVIVMQEGVDEEREEAVRDHDFLCKAFSGEQTFQVGEHVQYRIAELAEGARWLDAWYLDRLPNGRGHIVKSKAEGRIAVDPDKIRKAPRAEGCEEPKFKYGDRVQFRDEIPSTSEPHWLEGVYVERLSDGGHAVAFGPHAHVIHCSDKDIRRSPKAEGCEALVEHDAPQTPAELYDKIIASNPATFGRPRTPTGEELAEMAEEDEEHE